MNLFLASRRTQFFNKCPVSLQYRQVWSGLVVPSFPAESLEGRNFPRKGFGIYCWLLSLLPCWPVKLFLVADNAFKNAVVSMAGKSNSLIWEFSATAWSSFNLRSLICADYALIFLSFFAMEVEVLVEDFGGGGGASLLLLLQPQLI